MPREDTLAKRVDHSPFYDILHKLSLFDKNFCYIKGKGRTGAASPGVARKSSREIS